MLSQGRGKLGWKKGGGMPRIVEADILAIPGKGKLCSVVLDEWPEGLGNKDRLLVGGRTFDFDVEYIRWAGEVDSRPHLALWLNDDEAEAEWFIGKEAARA